MTKAIPAKRPLSQQRDGNQEDALALQPRNRSESARHGDAPVQLQSVDWHERKDPSIRSGRQPTSLEALLDLELDLVLPATAVSAPMSNQFQVCAAMEDLETDLDAVSLELLALQSPHGENQQWQTIEEDECAVMPASTPTYTESVRPEAQSPRQRKEMLTTRGSMRLDLMSPTEYLPCFPPSPNLSAAEDDYDLASPKALPDTPSQTRSEITLAWDIEPSYDDDCRNTGASHRYALSKSVQRPERQVQRVSSAARAATPNPRSHRNFATTERVNSRVTRSPLTLPEGRGKARHGGIYSLLLKNKSAKQEPLLVESTHNPEETIAAALSASTASPPRTFCKLKHGGIYKMLRSSHSTR